MLSQLKEWKEAGLLRFIDYHFAKFMGDIRGLVTDNVSYLKTTFAGERLGFASICAALDKLFAGESVC